ncbi:hypothetical protein CP061683_1223, partial [Chlamydia psittaci 06-1683]
MHLSEISFSKSSISCRQTENQTGGSKSSPNNLPAILYGVY